MRKLSKLSLLLSLVLAAGCEHQSTTFLQDRFEPIQENFSSITDPRARWEAYRLHDYVFEQQRICFCAPPPDHEVVVTNNQVTLVVGPSGEVLRTDIGMTVDQIFAWIDSLRQQKVDQLEVEYHARYGYPTRLALDGSFGTADDELTLHIKSLRKLRK